MNWQDVGNGPRTCGKCVHRLSPITGYPPEYGVCDWVTGKDLPMHLDGVFTPCVSADQDASECGTYKNAAREIAKNKAMDEYL